MRFVSNLKRRLGGNESSGGVLTSAERERAHNVLIGIAQHQAHGDEIGILLKGGALKKGNALLNCSPYLDEHRVLRMKDRIGNAGCIDDNIKRPILLPRITITGPITTVVMRRS